MKKLKDIDITKDKLVEALTYSTPLERMTFIGMLYPEYWKMTHQRMADYIGCSRETVSRLISRLRKTGYFK